MAPLLFRTDTPLSLSLVKLILLHDMKNDDGIRLFFGEVWELYTKVGRDHAEEERVLM